MNRTKMRSLFFKTLIFGATAVTMFVLASIIVYVLVKGIPHFSPKLFEWKYTSENQSMTPAIVNTLLITAMSLIVAVPFGVGAAVFLTEYAKKGNKIVSLVRLTSETLAGIPSIVYGLFGYLLFGIALGFRYSLVGGALTLAIMILPLIMRTTEEALKAVPDLFREGSFGLGAGKLRTIVRIVLPAAMPGILAGVILGVGRIVGETIALVYTAGTVAGIPTSKMAEGGEMLNVMGSGRTLAVHMYSLTVEGLHINEAYPVAVVLLLLVLGINALSAFIARKIQGVSG